MARTSKYLNKAEALQSTATWRAGLYLRISKEDGDKFESDSISNQKLIIEDFLMENPEINLEDVYPDDGYTGTNFDRPGFFRLIEDIRAGRINCVIVKDLSRFGRNYLEAGQYLEIFFPVMKVRFISVVDDIDSYMYPGSMNNISVSFKNVMNEEYCRDTSNKIRSTFAAKRENGEYIGSFPVYGYMKSPENRSKLIVDGEASDVVKLIFRLFLEGGTYRSITNRLNELGIPNPTRYKKNNYPNFRISNRRNLNDSRWSLQTVRGILRNRMYTGDLVQGRHEKISHKIEKLREVPEENWVIVENAHEAIIDKTAFYNVQNILKRDMRISQKTKLLGLFSGFLRCADCGRQMGKKNASREKFKHVYHYYTCRTYEIMHKSACTRHTTRSDILERAVFTVISKYIETAVNMDNLIETINKSPVKNAATLSIQSALETREQEKNKLEHIMLDLYPDWKNDLITKEQYVALKAKHQSELNKLNNVIEELKKTYEREKEGIDETNDFILNFKKYKNFNSLTREILIALVDHIKIHEGGEIEITFKFQDAFKRAEEYIETNRELLIGAATEIARHAETHLNIKEAL